MAASFADYSRAASLGEIEPTRHVDLKSERRRRMPVFEVGRGGAGQLECGVSHFGAFHVGEEEEGDWGETAAGLRLLSISNASSAAPVPTTDVPAVPLGFEPSRPILPLLLCIHPMLLLRLRHLARLLPQSMYLHLPPTTVYRFTITLASAEQGKCQHSPPPPVHFASTGVARAGNCVLGVIAALADEEVVSSVG
ncbi:hypothetical protein BDQ17DRAFT_1435190 [Cyathus striatus]|nr:hypothetical protein BDQ17DRAFT_1435190 [Cyathus striatus]